jgi:hypothetical protein
MLPAATPDKYPARSSCSPPLRQAGTVYRMEDGDRRFSEQEVDAILSHAVELEKAGLPQQGLERSLTLSELRDVAREAGSAEGRQTRDGIGFRRRGTRIYRIGVGLRHDVAEQLVECGYFRPSAAQPPDDRKIEKLDMDSWPVRLSSYWLLCRYSL